MSFINQLTTNDFNISTANRIRKFIDQTKRIYSRNLDNSIEEKDNLLLELRNKLGGNEELVAFRQKYHNINLEEILLNKRETTKIMEWGNSLIRKDEPVYKTPDHNIGRAHFFAAEKKLFNLYI